MQSCLTDMFAPVAAEMFLIAALLLDKSTETNDCGICSGRAVVSWTMAGVTVACPPPPCGNRSASQSGTPVDDCPSPFLIVTDVVPAGVVAWDVAAGSAREPTAGAAVVPLLLLRERLRVLRLLLGDRRLFA